MDCPRLAVELEARFPVLRSVSAEQTKRGRHYFFSRSALSDEGEYYDSCGTVLEHVDFKSVTQTGTCGVIVTAPSTDKVWLRPLWAHDYELVEIPDELLKSIAQPNGRAVGGVGEDASSAAPNQTAGPPNQEAAPPSADADTRIAPGSDVGGKDELLLSFEGCDCDMTISGASLELLRTSDYCAALLSGRWSTERSDTTANETPTTLSLPCTRADFHDTLAVLQDGKLAPGSQPTITKLARVDAIIDMMGFPPRETNPLLERGIFHADLYRIHPCWWGEHELEQTRRAVGVEAAPPPPQAIRLRGGVGDGAPSYTMTTL